MHDFSQCKTTMPQGILVLVCFRSWHPHVTKPRARAGWTVQKFERWPKLCDLGLLDGGGRENKNVSFCDCWDRHLPAATVCFWIWGVSEKMNGPGKLQEGEKSAKRIPQCLSQDSQPLPSSFPSLLYLLVSPHQLCGWHCAHSGCHSVRLLRMDISLFSLSQ